MDASGELWPNPGCRLRLGRGEVVSPAQEDRGYLADALDEVDLHRGGVEITFSKVKFCLEHFVHQVGSDSRVSSPRPFARRG